MSNIGVIGTGIWGTALALTATRAGNNVLCWARNQDVVDSINNEHEQFFVCDQQGIRVLSAEKANNVIAEKEKTIDNKDGSFSSVEKFFLFESSNTESIFKYALKKIRDKNLYFDDQNEIVKYGEYEPK